MKSFFQRSILGVRVNNLSLIEVVGRIEELIKAGGFHLVVTMNPEILMKARKDKDFLEIINRKTAIVTLDGMGIILAGKLLDQPFKERITGNDLIEPLVKLCLREKWSVMLMGGKPGVAQKALEKLKEKHPLLLGSATSEPSKPLSREGGSCPAGQLIKQLKGEKPAVVLIAMDFGEREKFILQLIKQLKNKDFRRGMVFVGVGGAMDYLASTAKRAPVVFQKLGLEWLWRLVTQPQKRFVRQMKALPAFGWLVAREAFMTRLRK